MVQRFSSRNLALSEARAKQKPGLPAYRPRGIRYDSFDDIFKGRSSAVAPWTYPAVGGAFIGTTVLMNVRNSKWKYDTNLAEHNGNWYADDPLRRIRSTRFKRRIGTGSLPKPKSGVDPIGERAMQGG